MIFLLVIAALKLIDLLSLTMKIKLILCRGIKIRSNIKVYYIFFIRYTKHQYIFCNDTKENNTEKICPSSMYDIFPTRIISVGSFNTLTAADSNCSVIDSENNSVAMGDIRDNSITLPTQITQSDDDNK